MTPQEITEQPETPAECLEVTPLEGMIQTALAQYEVSEASIAELAEAYKDLKINGLEDKEGYDKCHAARMHVKGLRVGVDKTRVGLKAGAIVYGKAMDGRARDLKALLVPIEQHLADEEAEFEAEREKARQERAKAKQALLTERMKQLDAVDARISRVIVDVMSEKAFRVALEQATKDFEVAQAEEAERKKEAAKAKAKATREANAERKKREAQEKEIKADRARLKKDQEEFARKKAEALPVATKADPEALATRKPKPATAAPAHHKAVEAENAAEQIDRFITDLEAVGVPFFGKGSLQDELEAHVDHLLDYLRNKVRELRA